MATEQLTSSVAVVVDEWVQRQYRNLNNVQVTASSVKVIQHLWGGFGILVRVAIDATSSGVVQRTVHHTDNEDEVVHSPSRLGPPPRSVVCKFINLPVSGSPSRGGRILDVGDARKLKSYFVEAAFYRHFAVQLIDERGVRIPRPLKIQIDPRVTYDPHKPNDPTFFILSDLQLEGLDDPRPGPTQASITGALYWLAIFHASFLSQPEKLQQARQYLWEKGCYWHLATRPDELAAIPQDSVFFKRANEWDAALHNAKFQTVCHGDAKLANFVFRRNSATAHASECGAVDFQYCGIGCGMSDVAYLLEDCVSCDTRAATDDTTALQRWEELTRPYLDTYFAALRRVLAASIEWDTIDALESEWRALFPIAHLDFWRFYLGWSSDARYKSEADLMKNVPPHIRCMASR